MLMMKTVIIQPNLLFVHHVIYFAGGKFLKVMKCNPVYSLTTITLLMFSFPAFCMELGMTLLLSFWQYFLYPKKGQSTLNVILILEGNNNIVQYDGETTLSAS